MALGEAEVVDGALLSEHLRAWVVEWLRERPISSNQSGFVRRPDKTSGAVGVEHISEWVPFVGPIAYLSEKTGIHQRRVSGICNGEYEYVPLSQADALLTAAGLNHLLADGTIEVIPSPRWSLERWVDYMMERGCG